jgi:hypothetical protein
MQQVCGTSNFELRQGTRLVSVGARGCRKSVSLGRITDSVTWAIGRASRLTGRGSAGWKRGKLHLLNEVLVRANEEHLQILPRSCQWCSANAAQLLARDAARPH